MKQGKEAENVERMEEERVLKNGQVIIGYWVWLCLKGKKIIGFCYKIWQFIGLWELLDDHPYWCISLCDSL